MRQLQLRVRLNGRRIGHGVRQLLLLHDARGSCSETYGRLFFFFFGCQSADVSADGNGGPPGFTIPGTTSSTPWAGVNQDHLYAHALATDHTWYGMDWN